MQKVCCTKIYYEKKYFSVVKLYEGNLYDTLVAGVFEICNGTKFYPLTLKVSPLNAAIQNNIVTFITGRPTIPSGNLSCGTKDQIILPLNANNILDFNSDPGCSNARAIINITDTVIFGTSISPRPYNVNCHDSYNAYVRAVRVR